MELRLTVQDELLWLSRARALDEETLTQIHQTYYPKVYRYIYSRVNEMRLAEDLTSDVFTRLLSALREKTAPQNSLRGWLFGVASRVVSDYYRQQKRATEVELSDMLPDGRSSLEDTVSQKLRDNQLRAAMQELTEEQQNVLALRFGFDMRIQEVAHLLGKSEGAVKQLQLRAIATLSKRLSPGVDVA